MLPITSYSHKSNDLQVDYLGTFNNRRMDNVFLIVIISLVLAILTIFLIIRNRKDERELEDQLKNDFHKSRNHDVDTGEKETI